MKNLLFFLFVTLICTNPAWPHGIDGHLYRSEDDRESSRSQPDQRISPSGKSLAQSGATESAPWWGARLSTGWTSREMHYGVDETGDYGAYTTELSFRIQNLTLSAWSGVGTGNDYQEWDFTVAYNLELGPVFFTPGYNFRYQPGVAEHGHSASETEGHPEEHGHAEPEHHDHSHLETWHSHGTFGNEIFFMLGTTVVPYVTPSVFYICDLNNTPGSYFEVRIDGRIPLYRGIFSLEPYTLLGVNLGYNTTSYYGWNHFQFGLRAIWKINRFVSVFGAINYSVAMTALKEIDQGDEVWARVGVTLAY